MDTGEGYAPPHITGEIDDTGTTLQEQHAAEIERLRDQLHQQNSSEMRLRGEVERHAAESDQLRAESERIKTKSEQVEAESARVRAEVTELKAEATELRWKLEDSSK